MAKKLSFLEVICVALLVNVIHWHVTSSFTVDPLSSTVAEERTTAAAIEPTTPILIEETPTTGPIDCSRYPCPADKYCAVNEATNRSECVCDTFCIYGYIPVCGSDGQTHFNDCFLRVTACQTNKVITVHYKGRCVIPTSTLPPPTSTSEFSEPPTTPEPTTPSSIEETTTIGPVDCSGYPCPENKYCVVNETNNRPQCICINFAPPIYDPVCGSDGQTHDNEYFLRGTACRTNTVITVQYKGRCSDPPTTTTPEIPEPPTTTEPTTPSPIEVTTTIGPVDCSGYPCPESKYCVVNETNNRPQCICINFVPPIYAPVCGSDGQTYSSAYDLNVTACQTNTVITVQRQGRCSDTPTPSTPPPTPTPPPSTPIPETQETPTTTEATATTPSVQSTTKQRRSKCRRRKHGRRHKNKGL